MEKKGEGKGATNVHYKFAADTYKKMGEEGSFPTSSLTVRGQAMTIRKKGEGKA